MAHSFWRSRGYSLVLIAAAVCMILAGLARGEAGAVMMKAVQVCLECIGVG